jgi:hypothetical protein
VRPIGLVSRQKGPNNLEVPFDQLGEFITLTELFYMRRHCFMQQPDPVTIGCR